MPSTSSPSLMGTPRKSESTGWPAGKPSNRGSARMSASRCDCPWVSSTPSMPCCRGNGPIAACSRLVIPATTNSANDPSGSGTPSAAYRAPSSERAEVTIVLSASCTDTCRVTASTAWLDLVKHLIKPVARRRARRRVRWLGRHFRRVPRRRTPGPRQRRRSALRPRQRRWSALRPRQRRWSALRPRRAPALPTARRGVVAPPERRAPALPDLPSAMTRTYPGCGGLPGSAAGPRTKSAAPAAARARCAWPLRHLASQA